MSISLFLSLSLSRLLFTQGSIQASITHNQTTTNFELNQEKQILTTIQFAHKDWSQKPSGSHPRDSTNNEKNPTLTCRHSIFFILSRQQMTQLQLCQWSLSQINQRKSLTTSKGFSPKSCFSNYDNWTIKLHKKIHPKWDD